MQFRKAFVFLVASLVLGGCSTEFDLTGEYEDRAVVYALLDPLDNPSRGGEGHFFRVQKRFLGSASAFEMAMVADSSYFDTNKVVVNLVEFDADSNVLGRFPLTVVTIDDKETGDPDDDEIDFFGPQQRLYYSNRNIDSTKAYGIEVLKKDLTTQDTTYAASAYTDIVRTNTFQFVNPSGNPSAPPQQMNLYNPGAQTYFEYNLRFKTATHAKSYEVWLTFHYRETVGGVEVPKSVTWQAGSVTAPTTEGFKDIQLGLAGENIISNIGSRIPAPSDPNAQLRLGIPGDNPNYTRDLDITLLMAGQDLFDYIDINNPNNTSAVQDKPVYSNINNGIGLFSSRTSATYQRIYFSENTFNILRSSPYTQHLNFIR